MVLQIIRKSCWETLTGEQISPPRWYIQGDCSLFITKVKYFFAINFPNNYLHWAISELLNHYQPTDTNNPKCQNSKPRTNTVSKVTWLINDLGPNQAEEPSTDQLIIIVNKAPSCPGSSAMQIRPVKSEDVNKAAAVDNGMWFRSFERSWRIWDLVCLSGGMVRCWKPIENSLNFTFDNYADHFLSSFL